MEKQISKAFTFMFQDEDWKYKIILLVLLTFPSSYISYLNSSNQLKTAPIFLVIVSIITSLIISGYFAKCTQNIIFATPDDVNLLPKWEDNFLSFISIGFKKFLGSLLIGIVMLPASLLIIPLLIFAYITIALERVFCEEFKISSYFAWKRAFDLIAQDGGRYFKILLAFIPLALLLVVVMLLFIKLPIILMIVIPAITAYYMLVSAYLIGAIGTEPVVIPD